MRSRGEPVGPTRPAPSAAMSLPTALRVRAGEAPVGRIRVGSVLARTFSIYARNLPSFGLISLVVFSPLIVYTAYVHLSATDPRLHASDVASWSKVYVWGSLVLSNVVAGPLTFGVIEQLRGRRPSVGACFGIGFARAPRVLATGFLLGLWLGVIFVAVLGLTALLLGLSAILGARLDGLGGDVLGPILMLGASYLYFCRLWVAVPAAVVEDVNPWDAIYRSQILTKGNLWRIFPIGVLFLLLDVATHLAVGQLSAQGTVSAGVAATAQVLLSTLVGAPFGAIACAVGYHDLRVTGEGVDTETLARVFE